MSVIVSFIGGLCVGNGVVGLLLGGGAVAGAILSIGAALLGINFLVLLPREMKEKGE